VLVIPALYVWLRDDGQGFAPAGAASHEAPGAAAGQ
jgi:hypothetical protein